MRLGLTARTEPSRGNRREGAGYTRRRDGPDHDASSSAMAGHYPFSHHVGFRRFRQTHLLGVPCADVAVVGDGGAPLVHPLLHRRVELRGWMRVVWWASRSRRAWRAWRSRMAGMVGSGGREGMASMAGMGGMVGSGGREARGRRGTSTWPVCTSSVEAKLYASFTAAEGRAVKDSASARVDMMMPKERMVAPRVDCGEIWREGVAICQSPPSKPDESRRGTTICSERARAHIHAGRWTQRSAMAKLGGGGGGGWGSCRVPCTGAWGCARVHDTASNQVDDAPKASAQREPPTQPPPRECRTVW